MFLCCFSRDFQCLFNSTSFEFRWNLIELSVFKRDFLASGSFSSVLRLSQLNRESCRLKSPFEFRSRAVVLEQFQLVRIFGIFACKIFILAQMKCLFFEFECKKSRKALRNVLPVELMRMSSCRLVSLLQTMRLSWSKVEQQKIIQIEFFLSKQSEALLLASCIINACGRVGKILIIDTEI